MCPVFEQVLYLRSFHFCEFMLHPKLQIEKLFFYQYVDQSFTHRPCFSGDHCVTISLVIPTVLDLHSQLKAKGDRVRQCGLLVTALLKSLVQRFRGIFQNCRMIDNTNERSCLQPPFSNKVYLIAVTLDPRFSLRWVDIDVHVDSGMESLKKTRLELKEMIEGELS